MKSSQEVTPDTADQKPWGHTGETARFILEAFYGTNAVPSPADVTIAFEKAFYVVHGRACRNRNERKTFLNKPLSDEDRQRIIQQKDTIPLPRHGGLPGKPVLHDKGLLPAHVTGFLAKDQYGLQLLGPATDSHTVGRFMWNGHPYEEGMHRLFKRLIKPGMRVVCCGGHVGTHALPISQHVGKKGRVFVFECNPRTLPYLRANIAFNNARNITLYPIAAYDKNTTLRFVQFPEHTGASHVETGCTMYPRELNETHVRVKAVALDSLIKEIQYIDVLQMDIEGCEDLVIKGMQKLLKASPNIVIVHEWTPLYCKDPAAYLKFWKDKGYQIASIDKWHTGRLTPLSDQAFLSADVLDILIAKDLTPYM